jgi:hypothetical protein
MVRNYRKKTIHVDTDVMKATGFRSKFEVIINDQLAKSGVKYSYEGDLGTIWYVQPEVHRRYISDFLLENGIIIEVKGLFDIDDRKKHVLIKKQYPVLDVRFVFMSDKTKINKGSKTSYGDWCESNGFTYAVKVLPASWLKERKSPEERAEIIRLLQHFHDTKGIYTNEKIR